MGELRTKMDQDLKLRGRSERTRESYLHAVAALAKYYRRSPDEISQAEVQRYLLYLIEERKLAWSTCNVAVSAFKFFYHVTLGRPGAAFELPRPRQPQKLPQILSREEVARLLASTPNLKHRALLATAYAAGLRVSELCRLRLTDIDRHRMTLRVEHGKGGKDRYTLLSPRLLDELRGYWLACRPRLWLFPSRDGGRPMNPKVAQKVFDRSKARADIHKDCGIHGLRHAFATHLLEAGVDMPTLQRLMGHNHISSTLRYLHLAQKHLSATASPLDLLPDPRPR